MLQNNLRLELIKKVSIVFLNWKMQICQIEKGEQRMTEMPPGRIFTWKERGFSSSAGFHYFPRSPGIPYLSLYWLL